MITPTIGDSRRVTCEEPDCPRPLDWTVVGDAHAENLERKHYREHHPGVRPPCDEVPDETHLSDLHILPLDLTAAARAYMLHQHREAGAVFAALLGIDPADVTRLADRAIDILAEPGTVLAHVPPIQ